MIRPLVSALRPVLLYKPLTFSPLICIVISFNLLGYFLFIIIIIIIVIIITIIVISTIIMFVAEGIAAGG